MASNPNTAKVRYRFNVFFEKYLEDLSKPLENERVWVTYLIPMLLIVFFGPIAFAYAIVYRKKNLPFAKKSIALALSLFWSAFLVLKPLQFSFSELLSDGGASAVLLFFIFNSIVNLPLIPICAMLLDWGLKFRQHMVPIKTLQDAMNHEEKRVDAQYKEATSRARKTLNTDPGLKRGMLALGSVIRSDAFPSHVGISTAGNWMFMEESLLDKHMFILGTTGSGKTETLLRIASEVLNNTDRRLYFVDGKGDLEIAGKIATMAYQRKGVKVPIFKLGHTHKGAVYNGFVGNNDDIYNRLCEMLGTDEVEGNAKYYAYQNKSLLQLICGVGHEELKLDPPRSFTQVLERLTSKWLSETYADNKVESEFIETAVRKGQVADLYSQMATFGRSFGNIISDKGFTLEGSQCAIFSMRTQSAGTDSKHLIDFLITDVKDWIGKRQPAGSRGLLIIDEFGAFGNYNIAEVLSLARSSHLGVILATQSLATLGDLTFRQRIIANCNTFMLMKTNEPDEMIGLAGTVIRPETSHQFGEGGEATGMGSARIQHQFKIDPNKVARLEPGQAWLINSRYTAQLQVAKINPIDFDVRAVAPNQEQEVKTQNDSTARRVNPTMDIPK